jgi:hypothetical protein
MGELSKLTSEFDGEVADGCDGSRYLVLQA